MHRKLRSEQDKRNDRPRVRVRARQKKVRDRDAPSHRPGEGRDRGEAEPQRHPRRNDTGNKEAGLRGGLSGRHKKTREGQTQTDRDRHIGS